MKEPHRIAEFKIPIAISIPVYKLDEIRQAVNEAIVGDKPVNIRSADEHWVENPDVAEFREQLKQAHSSLNASHIKQLTIAVYSDGSLEIT